MGQIINMDFSKFLDWLKPTPKHYFAIAIVTAILLFSPRNFLERLGVNIIVDQFHPWFGVLFLLSIFLLLSYSVSPLYEFLKNKLKLRNITKNRIKRLHSLTKDEKALLRGYICENTRTQYLRPDDGVVRGLECEQIIYRASEIGAALSFEFAYNIQPWAWNFLMEHQELLDDEYKGSYDPDNPVSKLKKFLQSRPF